MTDINTTDVAAETIQATATLVDMDQTKWTTEKVHSMITEEVRRQHGAAGRAGKYKVNLANGFEHVLQSMTRLMSRAYHTYLRMTLPWGEGQRLLSNTQLVPFLQEMQKHTDELNKAKASALPKITAGIAVAIQRNGGMCTAADYPSPQDIVDRFTFAFDFTPIPTAACFTGLPEGFTEVFEDRYNQRVGANLKQGIVNTAEKLHKLLQDFLAVSTAKNPKFHQSTLDNIEQFNDTLKCANLMQDTVLRELTDRVTQVTQYTTDQLKCSAALLAGAEADTRAAIKLVQKIADISEPVVVAPTTTLEVPAVSAVTLDNETKDDPSYELGSLDDLLGLGWDDEPTDPEQGAPTVQESEPAHETVSTVETPEPAEPAQDVTYEDVEDDIASLFNDL